jgi:Flp pilus assembly pilin Flp
MILGALALGLVVGGVVVGGWVLWQFAKGFRL